MTKSNWLQHKQLIRPTSGFGSKTHDVLRVTMKPIIVLSHHALGISLERRKSKQERNLSPQKRPPCTDATWRVRMCEGQRVNLVHFHLLVLLRFQDLRCETRANPYSESHNSKLSENVMLIYLISSVSFKLHNAERLDQHGRTPPGYVSAPSRPFGRGCPWAAARFAIPCSCGVYAFMYICICMHVCRLLLLVCLWLNANNRKIWRRWACGARDLLFDPWCRIDRPGSNCGKRSIAARNWVVDGWCIISIPCVLFGFMHLQVCESKFIVPSKDATGTAL